ncbi:PDZ domain-containing protein [Natrarchaeobius halalkaliphilus]|uniref:PDZ domain-containing protein n=1 Tax=Natrarchaeobius halalkaliphilus TaxID=1679091 RepID=A0A3N6LMS0_9EURY|nr:site-2 protease family protein [Natrarchaeobius halalkaliphilus]RQG89127.1 PDZ domain-containing protein [Natrarchaeobius halalkaliphilus]
MVYGSPAFVSPPELFGSELLTWVLVGLFVYWFGIILLKSTNLLPAFIGAQGPILTFHTKRGRAFLDWLSGPKRFWRAWANLGIGIALVVMVAMFVFLLFAAIGALTSPQPTSSVQQPRNVLVIPGVNDFLPLSATPGIVFGLLVGLVVHEGGHGLLCRVEDIDIESMGVAMLAIIPIGAFVEPEQESSRNASRGGQTRMFAAGVTNNFAITIVVFALLFGPVIGSIAVAPGAAVGGVAPDSPAASAGIEPNDRITAINGESVEDNDALTDRVEAADGNQLTVELNGEETIEVDRSLLVTAAIGDDITGLDAGDKIIAVGDQEIATETELLEAVGESETATLTVETDDGIDEREVPIGALVEIADDGPLVESDAPANEHFVITSFDGERTPSQQALNERLGTTDPGDEVTVAGYLDGERVEYDVTLGDRSQVTGGGTVGFYAVSGISGFSAETFGVQLYPAEAYLSVLGGETDEDVGAFTDSFLGKIGFAVLLPIAGVLEVLPYNFAGFAGGIENFYQVEGSLAAFGDWTVFAIANLLFWTGWINLQLGFFNCIPAFPLDGGHILRTSTEAVVSRLPIDATRGMVRVVTTTVGVAMLISFLAMLFAPGLLAG